MRVVVTNTSRALGGWAEAMAMPRAAGHEIHDPDPLGSSAPKREDLAGADGLLSGAGIDVYADEPCTANPLFELPNTALTPHVAGLSPDTSKNSRLTTAENLVAALAGRPVRVVNAEVLSIPHCRAV